MNNDFAYPTKLAWLAGINDGEGCIYARLMNGKPNNLSVTLSIKVTSKNMIAACCEILEQLNIEYKLEPRKSLNPKHKPQIVLRIQKKKSLAILLESIKPYSVVKLPEIERTLVYLHKSCLYHKYTLDESDRTLINDLKAMKLIA